MSSAEAVPIPPARGAGSRFLTEIREQPAALGRLLDAQSEFARVAAEMRERGATTVRMVGHGSSDNAASYGVYAFGLLPHWTALRDSISLTVYYGADLDMSGSTALALSQSGRTPDVVEYARRARRRGAFTVAITNDPESELAGTADAVLPLSAGREDAVAATKTYTNQVAALGLLAAHAAGVGSRFADELRVVAGQLEELTESMEAKITAVAVPFAYAGRMFVVGRGAEFATAREIALKLLETCRVAAEPLTATDLAHGPVAALDSLFPVWAIASDDPTLPAVLEAVARAREAGATVIASGSAAEAIPSAEYVLPVPRPRSSLLTPLLSVVPGQLFAWALARTKGFDPDEPRGLSKVTLAR
ncbi:MAG TPA: SIS domain-containing protein [Gaiellaceae bacterium]|nr:SIS domain-containing protein [Gaiellaceae bacterium]